MFMRSTRTTGAIVWQRNVGTPAPGMGLISPVGITGTPVIDLASRALILVAVISGPNNMIYSLNVDTVRSIPVFPIDVNASFQTQLLAPHARGALTPSGIWFMSPTVDMRIKAIIADACLAFRWTFTTRLVGDDFAQIWNLEPRWDRE